MKCELPCEKCNGSSSLCLSCGLGYTYDTSFPSNCRPNNSSNTTLTNFMVCPFGTILSNFDCAACQATSKCARCNSSNLAACTSCLNGYYLSSLNTTCLPCGSGCAKCLSDKFCLSCSDGFVS